MFSESAIECYDFSISAVGAADGGSEAGEGGGPAEGLGSTSPLFFRVVWRTGLENVSHSQQSYN